MSKTAEETFPYCTSCACEFSLDDPAVTILVPEKNGRCVITLDGRAHDISFLTWKKIQARRALERTAHKVTPMTIYHALEEIKGE
jgi:hypothetical protein